MEELTAAAVAGRLLEGLALRHLRPGDLALAVGGPAGPAARALAALARAGHPTALLPLPHPPADGSTADGSAGAAVLPAAFRRSGPGALLLGDEALGLPPHARAALLARLGARLPPGARVAVAATAADGPPPVEAPADPSPGGSGPAGPEALAAAARELAVGSGPLAIVATGGGGGAVGCVLERPWPSWMAVVPPPLRRPTCRLLSRPARPRAARWRRWRERLRRLVIGRATG